MPVRRRWVNTIDDGATGDRFFNDATALAGMRSVTYLLGAKRAGGGRNATAPMVQGPPVTVLLGVPRAAAVALQIAA